MYNISFNNNTFVATHARRGTYGAWPVAAGGSEA